ncbi:MAG: 3-dehydroquinate synthase [Acetobacteraceae bacterium]|nr:3-dehydroquinate synthase [Acetobacteraceae bacterium]
MLIGLMGAGKSAIGKRLAARLGLGFHDADAEIEQAAGMTVAEIFARLGEAAFRDGERRVIARLLAGPPMVIAAGGGAFMDAATRAVARRHATTIWLRVPLPILVRRVSGREGRPLLAGKDPAAVLSRLSQLRNPIYAEADIIVDCTDEPADGTTSRVQAALAQHTPPQRVPVELDARRYEVLIGPGLIGRAGAHAASLLRGRRAVLVADRTVAGLCLPALRQGLAETGFECIEAIVPAGEASKSLPALEQVLRAALSGGIDRRTAVFGIGGGVVGDLAGFAAAVLLRGLDFVQVPTTLLAQVDSSVGGKTGINMPEGKNLVGAFHQPKLVLADTLVLASLPRRELAAGYAEIFKAGLIGDPALARWCEANAPRLLAADPATLAEAVAAAVAFKAAVVAADEFERDPEGGRALLNLGHTFAHAFEAEFAFDGTLLHGEAVALGLCLAFALSARLGLCSEGVAAWVQAHIAAAGLPATLAFLPRPVSAARLIGHMRKDKKVRDGRMVFILARGIGQAFVATDVEEQAVRALLLDEGCTD